LQEIVALSGAHTLGRARPDRSGWGKPETKYTVYSLVTTSHKNNFVQSLNSFESWNHIFKF